MLDVLLFAAISAAILTAFALVMLLAYEERWYYFAAVELAFITAIINAFGIARNIFAHDNLVIFYILFGLTFLLGSSLLAVAIARKE